MEFEWELKKAALNLKRYDVPFLEGATVFMKKKISSEMKDELRPEYELTKLLKGGVRGKCAERYRARSNVVVLAPDVAQAFPTEETVNETLRLVMRMALIPVGIKRPPAQK